MFLNCLNLKLHSIFEKKSEKEVPLWTPSDRRLAREAVHILHYQSVTLYYFNALIRNLFFKNV